MFTYKSRILGFLTVLDIHRFLLMVRNLHFTKRVALYITYVASVGSVFNDARKVENFSLPETIKEKSTFRAKALRRELANSGGSGKTTRVFIRVNTKTSRDKIKANQMDFIKTKCKQRNVNRIA